MARKEPRPIATPVDQNAPASLGRRHQRVGWTLLFIAMLVGTTLEAALGFKATGLLLDPIRREFWSLSHFHAGMMALVNLVYVAWSDNPRLTDSQQQLASRALLAGTILLPLGFFLGGLIHAEGDPGVGIFLVPLGAAALLIAIGLQARAAWQA